MVLTSGFKGGVPRKLKKVPNRLGGKLKAGRNMIRFLKRGNSSRVFPFDEVF